MLGGKDDIVFMLRNVANSIESGDFVVQEMSSTTNNWDDSGPQSFSIDLRCMTASMKKKLDDSYKILEDLDVAVAGATYV